MSSPLSSSPPSPSSPSLASLNQLQCTDYTRIVDLPDDVILRILAHIGKVDEQIAIGYKLASLCSRLRQLLRTQFLPSITTVHSTTLNALCLGRPTAVREALTSFFSCTTNLRELKLAGCSALLSPESFTAISNAATSTLTSVNLAHCQLSDECLAPLLKCTSLKRLELASCHLLTGVAFRPDVCRAPLRVLDLSWIQTLTREGISAVSTLKTLRVLSVTGCEIMNSQSLHIMATSDIRLSLIEIRLSCCPVQDDALFDFLRAASKVKTLVLAQFTANLWPTGDFTIAGIERLRTRFPKVNIKLGM